jgi:hypothetical protein
VCAYLGVTEGYMHLVYHEVAESFQPFTGNERKDKQRANLCLSKQELKKEHFYGTINM